MNFLLLSYHVFCLTNNALMVISKLLMLVYFKTLLSGGVFKDLQKKIFLAFDFCRFCVVIRFFIPTTTANDLRL